MNRAQMINRAREAYRDAMTHPLTSVYRTNYLLEASALAALAQATEEPAPKKTAKKAAPKKEDA